MSGGLVSQLGQSICPLWPLYCDACSRSPRRPTLNLDVQYQTSTVTSQVSQTIEKRDSPCGLGEFGIESIEPPMSRRGMSRWHFVSCISLGWEQMNEEHSEPLPRRFPFRDVWISRTCRRRLTAFWGERRGWLVVPAAGVDPWGNICILTYPELPSTYLMQESTESGRFRVQTSHSMVWGEGGGGFCHRGRTQLANPKAPCIPGH